MSAGRTPVVDLWPSVIDGGALAGTLVVQMRLQADPVSVKLTTLDEVMSRLAQLARGMRWVVASSLGDPLVHNCAELTTALRSAGYLTAVETAGIHAMSGKWSWVTLAPQRAMERGRSVRPDMIAAASEIRWRVATQKDVNALLHFLSNGLHQKTCGVVIVPNTKLNYEALSLCTEVAAEHGWRIGLAIGAHRTQPTVALLT